MPLIDGKLLANEIREKLKAENASLERRPVLDIIVAEDDEESLRYVKLKQKAVEEIGGQCHIHPLGQVSTEEVISLIGKLNDDPEVHGILAQLPLPPGIDADRVIGEIKTTKDVDGFNPWNLGLMFTNRQYFSSCAAMGVMYVADKYAAQNPPKVLLIGNSFDVIKPLASLFMAKGCPVTAVPVLEAWIDPSRYDVAVIEAGDPESIDAGIFDAQTLVVDAGFHWIDGKACGNVRKDGFTDEGAPWLLPVPGGLGPLLIAMLLSNLLKAVKFND